MEIFRDNSALLIVDMIKDFADPEGKLFVSDAKQTVSYIASLISEARKRGITVIYVNDSHDSDDEEFKKWGVHAVEGTWGSKVIDELSPANSDYVLEKKRFSAFFSTKLEELMKKLGVKHIVLVGTVTNICIFVSAVDAIMRGYEVTVPRKGVSALNNEDNEFALDQLSRVFGADVV
ncbi:MAG: cysteine hydrolase [Actinomycetota bacterium]|nr:cysteine hydrolase [Actinomycetota bacterium]